MTWREFTGGLTAVARTGSTQALAPHVTSSLEQLGMICGSEADSAGVTLTASGRGWYQRTVVDRENDTLLVEYGRAMDRFMAGGD